MLRPRSAPSLFKQTIGRVLTRRDGSHREHTEFAFRNALAAMNVDGGMPGIHEDARHALVHKITRSFECLKKPGAVVKQQASYAVPMIAALILMKERHEVAARERCFSSAVISDLEHSSRRLKGVSYVRQNVAGATTLR